VACDIAKFGCACEMMREGDGERDSWTERTNPITVFSYDIRSFKNEY
jgi:hypothetical protein